MGKNHEYLYLEAMNRRVMLSLINMNTDIQALFDAMHKGAVALLDAQQKALLHAPILSEELGHIQKRLTVLGQAMAQATREKASLIIVWRKDELVTCRLCHNKVRSGLSQFASIGDATINPYAPHKISICLQCALENSIAEGDKAND